MNQPCLDLSGYHSPMNLAAALSARDEGIDLVMENSGEWKDDALAELEKIYLERRHEENPFTFEMLKYPVVSKVGKPHSQNCWGGLAQKMVKLGWIKCTGTDIAKSVSRHASLVRVYRWVS